MTCCSFRVLIQPELASGAMPHLRVPRDTPTVQRAIELSPRDGTIWVAEGVYQERISLSKTDVHLVGLGGAANTVIGDGCEVTEGKPRLTGLTFKGDVCTSTLELGDTHAVLEGCVVEGGTGVEVKGRECNPQFDSCQIRDSKGKGVAVLKEGMGVFSKCDIHRNAMHNVWVKDSSNPQFHSCQIRDSGSTGVLVLKEGLGVFTKCDIHSNAKCNVWVQDSGNPQFDSCQIRDSKSNGVAVLEEGMGVFTKCDIHSNAKTNVASP